ncbi:MAG: HlyD family type I secretion periplasmic adaptor subunit [Pseudomonadota bacterium]
MEEDDIAGARPAPSGARVAAWTIYGIGALVSAALLWAAATTIPEIVRAEGQIAPLGRLRGVDHYDGGVVTAVDVALGDAIVAGQAIAMIEPPSLQADLAAVEQEIAQAERIASRAATMLDLLEGKTSDMPIDVYVASRHSLAQARLAAMRLRIERQVISREAAERVRDNARARIKLSDVRTSRAEALHERGVLSRAALSDRLDEAERVRADLLEADLAMVEAEGGYHDAQAALIEAEISLRESLLSEREEAIRQLDRLFVHRDDLTGRLSRTTVRAPVDGVIQELFIAAPGQVVPPGGPIASILPSGDRLVARVRLSPRDIGHVGEGDAARLKVTTFDARRYGHVPGRIAVVSPTSQVDGDGQPWFEVTILPEEDGIGTSADLRPLRAGMEVTGEIVSRERTVLGYLLKPIERVLETSMGER